MNRLAYPYDETVSPALPVIEIEVEGYGTPQTRQRINAIVDSGSDGTMVPRPALLAAGAIFRDTVRMRGVTGGPQLVDRYLTKIHIGDATVRGIFAVAVSAGDEALLGRDVLNELTVTLNGPAHVTEITLE